MTWAEWVDSKYNTVSAYNNGGYISINGEMILYNFPATTIING